MGNKELRNVAGGEVMECFISSQQDLVVYSELYRMLMEGCKNARSNVLYWSKMISRFLAVDLMFG